MRCPFVACPLALAWLGACTSSPPPLSLPPRTITVHHLPQGELAALDGGSPQTLHIELVALRAAPAGPAVDLVAATITREDGAPFRGASSLPTGSRWLVGDDFDRWQQARAQLDATQLQVLATTEAVLVPELVTRLTVPDTTLPEVRLTAGRGDATGSVMAALSPFLADTRRETVELARGPTAGGGALLFVPTAEVGDAAGQALVIRPTTSRVASEAVAAARADATPPPAPPSNWPQPWQQALTAVGPHVRRPALLALAYPLPIPRVRDVLLITDDQALIDITAELRGVDPAAADLAWQFERAVWLALLPRLERDELPAAMSAACWRHLGTAADDAGLLRLTLATAQNAEAFAAVVHDENLAALAARDAAQRVRAHDWLLANGGSVDGYAPLDAPEGRRAALRRHAAAREAAEASR